jgi:DivIVA domain-containing protein
VSPVWNGGADRGVLARNAAWRAHDVTVDGDTTETSETADPTQAPAATDNEHPEPQPERVSAEQLCDYVERVSFATTLGRRGYQQSEVDALMVKVAETLRAGEPLADLIRHTHLTHVRLEDGYDHNQVDDFLAAVVDLDPHAEARHEVARSGFIGKLFG